jgi:endoglucanase
MRHRRAFHAVALVAALGFAACSGGGGPGAASGGDGGDGDGGSGGSSGGASGGGSGSSSGSASGSGSGSGGGSGSGSGSGSDGGGGADGGGDAIGTFVGGTNLSGAEFGTVPGNYGTDYLYPPHSDVDYFVGKGFRIFRIPFLWERMQPNLQQPLASAELARLQDLVSYATSKGAYVLVDPHNYARYNGNIIGDAGSPVGTADFADFWSRLSALFASNDHAIFGLMNEPHDMATSLWLTDANAAIAAIRKGGARNVVFVPGNSWTGAHSWTDGGSSSNATVMLGVQDPLSNYVFEAHQYLDSDYSGTHADCQSTTIGSQSLQAFTQWLQTNHLRGFLGEFGVANNTTCMAALEDMLSYIDQNRSLWAGWTWWSAGPLWGSYMFSIEPSNGMDAPQTATLVKHL